MLGRVERFGGRLQVQVRTVEAAPDTDPADADADDAPRPGRARRLPRLPRRVRSRHAGLAAVVGGILDDDVVRGRVPRRFPPPAPTVTTATRVGCSSTPSGSRRSVARPPSSIRACAHDLLARRRAPARRRPHARARPRPVVPPDRGGAPARSRPSRPAADRGARRPLSTRRLAPSSSTRSPHTTTGRPRAPPRPPCSTTRTSSTPRPRPGPSGNRGG